MIETGGTLFQLLGLPRSTGQIWGLLYISARPLSLDDLVEALSISKASASIGSRHLAAWGAVRRVWVPGDRRDHFELAGDLDEIVRAAYQELVRPKLDSSGKRLSSIVAGLEKELGSGMLSPEEHKLCSDRIRSLLRFQKKVQSIGPLAEKLLS